MFVVSDTSAKTPSSAIRANFATSNSRPSTGVWSNLKSPVWTDRPASVLMANANESGMLCATWIGST
jgi:hypothetical protein